MICSRIGLNDRLHHSDTDSSVYLSRLADGSSALRETVLQTGRPLDSSSPNQPIVNGGYY